MGEEFFRSYDSEIGLAAAVRVEGDLKHVFVDPKGSMVHYFFVDRITEFGVVHKRGAWRRRTHWISLGTTLENRRRQDKQRTHGKSSALAPRSKGSAMCFTCGVSASQWCHAAT